MKKRYLPKYRITDDLLRIISEAEHLRAWLRASRIDIPWLEKLRFETLIKQAHFSTSIEGNPLTLPEVESLSRGDDIPAGGKAKQEVINYFAALRWIEKQKPDKGVTEEKLLHLHRLLTRNILPPSQAGKYKTRQNYIAAAGRIVYTPPGPRAVKSLTAALLYWLGNTGKSAHPIIAQAIAHYEFVRIHPFTDGNGRCARCLATWILYIREFDTDHIFAVDQFYREDHEGYYEALQAVRKENGSLTSWLEYCALAIRNTLERTQRRIRELSIPAKLKISLTRQQESLVLELRDKNRSVNEMIKLLGIKRARLYNIIRPLVKAGIIHSSKTRPVIYRLKRS